MLNEKRMMLNSTASKKGKERDINKLSFFYLLEEHRPMMKLIAASFAYCPTPISDKQNN